MLIKSLGFELNDIFIPPFELNAGELLTIKIKNGFNTYETETSLKNVFTKKIETQSLIISENFMFVEHFKESTYKEIFCQTTIEKYLRKFANPKSEYYNKIYEYSWIKTKTKVKSLAGTQRRLLNLYATLSNSNNIIFDTITADPDGEKKIYNTVKNEVKKGGCAIFIDVFGGIDDIFLKKIEIEYKI